MKLWARQTGVWLVGSAAGYVWGPKVPGPGRSWPGYGPYRLVVKVWAGLIMPGRLSCWPSRWNIRLGWRLKVSVLEAGRPGGPGRCQNGAGPGG